jgi:hypothetical protein
MTHPLQSLIAAPLANATKINTPGGKRPAPRVSKQDFADDIGPKVSAKELRERKAKAASEKLSKLFDYYAGTDLTAEKVAEHMGLYRQEQTGLDETTGKPILTRVLDVKRAADQLAWRRMPA